MFNLNYFTIMKKKNYLFLIGLIGFFGLFTACEEDGTETDDVLTITIASGAPSEAAVGDVISFDVSIVADAKISEIEVRKGTSTYDTKTDFQNKTSDVYTFEYEVVEADAGQTLEFAFIVTDNKDNTETADYSVTIDDLAPTITEFTAVIMGAHENADYGSFLDAHEGMVYKVSEAKNNQDKVDIVYYYGATNQATLAAPDDAGAAEFNVYDLDNWTTKNATRFTDKLTVDFAGIITSDDIDTEVGSPSATKANELSVDDVVGFETSDGKKGVAKIAEITTGTTGSITIDVKIQL
jgi:hypothetical protein